MWHRRLKDAKERCTCQERCTSVSVQLCLLLQSLHFYMLSEAWRAQPSLDIVAVGVQLLRERVGLMVDLLRAGLVKAEVRQGGAAAHAVSQRGTTLSTVP